MISQNPAHLKICQVGQPVLRQVARPLSVEEILSPQIQNLILSMKESVRSAPGVGLAAPQIGESIQLAVVEDRPEYHAHLTPQQLVNMERTEVPFHVIINPKLYIESEYQAQFFEGCLSISGYLGIVSRAKAVLVECYNEKAMPVVIHAKGWYARILQHEIDHLQGIVYLDRADLKTITTLENYHALWKGKPIDEVLKVLSHGGTS